MPWAWLLIPVAVFGAHSRSDDATATTPDTWLQLEKIIVTGSNIPTTEIAAEARTSPVLTIDRQAIETSGIFNTTELLQKLTLANGGSVPLSNNASGFTTAGTALSLRGLGPDATLVLINGRRVAPYPVGVGGTTAFVDLNSIPLSAIERIEVLKDGASATYGADAVAGVVNIILRRHLTGTVATVTYGNTTNRDSANRIANLVYGRTFTKGSFTVCANYQNRESIFNRDRAYSAVPPFLSTNSSPPNLQVTRAAVLQALGLAADAPLTINGVADTTTPVFFASTFPLKDTNHGSVPAQQYLYTTGRSSTFNFNEFSSSYPKVIRQGVFLVWDHDLNHPHAKIYGDAFFQRVAQRDELAPYATGNFTSPGQTTIVIPARTPDPLLTPAELAAGGRTAAAGAFNPFNPFNQDLAGGSRMRLAEFGNRTFEHTNTALALTAGLKFDHVADKFTVDAYARYSAIDNRSNLRLISTSRLLRVLNAADPIFQPSSPSYLGTTTPYNPFGYFRHPLATNRAVVDYAIQHQRDHNVSSLFDLGVLVNTAQLWALPAGSVGFALGADFRREAIDQRPDSVLQAGDILGAPPAAAIIRQRKITSCFAELELPLLRGKNTDSYPRALSLNLAARYERFLTSNRRTFVPKVGVRWMPRDDTLVFRASWGQGYREPSLYELYSGVIARRTAITDPVTGRFELEQPITVTGNPRLKSEKSHSLNGGAVWSPQGPLAGFTIALDYWHIQRSGQVLANYQDAVERSVTGSLEPGETIVRDDDGSLLQVNTIFRNVGLIEVGGVDLTTSYTWPTAALGRFATSLSVTRLTRFDYQTAPTLPLVDYLGQQDPRAPPGNDGILRWKGQGWIDWSFKSLRTRFTATYTDGFGDVDATGNKFAVRSTVFCDVQVSGKLFPAPHSARAKRWNNLKVTVGATNVFDQDPPFASGGGGNASGYPGFLYTSVGRFLYVSLEQKL